MNAIEILNHWGARFMDFAAPMLVQSSLLIIVLFALDLLLRKHLRAVVRYALWMLVLVKLVLPPSFAAPTGLAYWLPQKKAVRATPASPGQFVVRHLDVIFHELPVLQSLPSPRAKLQFAGWALLGWLATTLVLMALLVRRSRSVIRTASQAIPASDAPGHSLHACLQQMGIRQRVDLKLSTKASSPAVCGLWRPVVLIPQQMADKLSALQLRAVLLHELAHIKRNDVWVHYAQTWLQIIYWWHPLLWLANARIRRVREQAVDEMVMIQMGAEAETYPATLLEVAKLAFKRPMLALGLVGIVESKSALAQRIHSMINRPVPKSARLGFTGLAALLLAGAAFLPMARGQRTPYQPPRAAPGPSQQPVVGMDVKFIEIEESKLAALSLGEPTLTEFNGHRAWALSPEQLNALLQRALEQTETDVLTAPRVTTFSGRQSRIQVGDVVPVEGTEIRTGPTCDLIPIVSGELIDLAVVASVTERRPVEPTAPFTSVADAFLTNEVGTARVLVGNGGGVVLENPEARSSKGNRYLVIVSATIVSTDRAAESQPRNQASAAATNVAADSSAWARTYACGNIRLTLDRNGTYLASSEEDGIRRSETGTWKKNGREFILERETGDLRYAIRRLRVDEQHPTHLLWVYPRSNLSLFGAIDYFSFKPAEFGPNDSQELGFDWFLGNTLVSNGRMSFQGGTAAPEEDKGKRVHLREKADKVPVLGDIPSLGRLFRSRTEAIHRKLDRIVLPEVRFEGESLPQAIQWLSQEARRYDPEDTGVNFLFKPGVPPSTSPVLTVDPRTGNPLPKPTTADMNRITVTINPALLQIRLADVIGAVARAADKPIRYSVTDSGVVFSPDESIPLETRTFRLNPRLFEENLRKQMSDPNSTDLQGLVRRFFAAAGLSASPPNMIFFNDRTGVLMVRSTGKDLDIAQKALELLNYSPPQITIEARFMELPTEAAKRFGLDLPPPGQAAKTWSSILTAGQMQTIFHAAERFSGVETLTAPKVTTLSGRQTQIQVVAVTNILVGIDPRTFTPPGVQPTNGAASPLTGSPIPVGTVLDLVPEVASDGYTIHLKASPTATGFLRSDTKLGAANKARVWPGGKAKPARLPPPILRTRQMQAEVDLYDGQTLVLGNPAQTIVKTQPNGESVTEQTPEESAKRLLVFITPTIIDPAGNPIHPPGKEPFSPDVIPAQLSR